MDTPEHPADLERDCTKQRPLGYTSRKEHRIYTHYQNRYVVGEGHGTSVNSQQEADEIAACEAEKDAKLRARVFCFPIGASNLWPVGSLP
jgi:hypothetical protein